MTWPYRIGHALIVLAAVLLLPVLIPMYWWDRWQWRRQRGRECE